MYHNNEYILVYGILYTFLGCVLNRISFLPCQELQRSADDSLVSAESHDSHVTADTGSDIDSNKTQTSLADTSNIGNHSPESITTATDTTSSKDENVLISIPSQEQPVPVTMTTDPNQQEQSSTPPPSPTLTTQLPHTESESSSQQPTTQKVCVCV